MKNHSTLLHPGNHMTGISMIIFFGVLTTGFLSGCDDSNDNYLEGAVTDGYDMNFDSVRVRLYPETALSIEYVKKTKSGEQLPLKITIDYPEGELVTGKDYSLLLEGTISRGAAYDSSPLPQIESGTIHLDEFDAAAGSDVNGAFEAVFITTSNAKISLRGGFSAKLDRFEQ